MDKEKELMVSVLCMAFNHEKYIHKAIESILDQRTDFKYEIIIHDDCSTDRTTDIIREYERKFPDIIKPIYQSTNQYSQNISILTTYLLPKAKGKYVAFCECDDFWTDPLKLQKQVDYLESHPECSLCIHNAERANQNGEKIGLVAPVASSRIVTCEEVILGGGAFCATNSIVAPTYLAKKRPDYMKSSGLDYIWQMYYASCGQTYCFEDTMSAYRVDVEGSWTISMRNNMDKYWDFLHELEKMMNGFDEYTKYKYHNAIEISRLRREYMAYIMEGKYEKLFCDPYKSCGAWENMSIKTKCKIILGKYCPWLLKRLKK